MTSELGQRLHEERLRRREPEAAAATFFGVSQASYHRWESGQHEPKPQRYRALADYLGTDVADVATTIRGESGPGIEALRRRVEDLERDLREVRRARAPRPTRERATSRWLQASPVARRLSGHPTRRTPLGSPAQSRGTRP